MVVDVQGWYDEDKQKAILTDPCVHCSVVGLLDNEDRTLVRGALQTNISRYVFPQHIHS